MDALPDRPLTWQEITLLAVTSIILPGAGVFLALIGLAITGRAGQTWPAVLFATIIVWSIALLFIILSLN